MACLHDSCHTEAARAVMKRDGESKREREGERSRERDCE